MVKYDKASSMKKLCDECKQGSVLPQPTLAEQRKLSLFVLGEKKLYLILGDFAFSVQVQIEWIQVLYVTLPPVFGCD